MSSLKHTAYERLKELHTEAESASYAWTKSGKSTEWRQKVQTALRRLYGDDCDQLEAFNKVRYGPIMLAMNSPASVFHEAFMDGMKSAMAIIRSAIQEYEDYERQPDTSSETLIVEKFAATRKVFVVHGHDNEMKESVARFLERIDFKPIILHEQASGGDTIIEKFERHADVSYAVVLLSPDDIGAGKAAKPDELQPRARQNVVLELGYFVGRLGRSHVCPLVRSPLEVPSDFHGVVYVPFEGETWKIHLVKELKNIGFDIDANKAF